MDWASREDGFLLKVCPVRLRIELTPGSPRVGKTTLAGDTAQRFAEKVTGQPDLAIVDKIGQMEMTSPKFKTALSQVFDQVQRTITKIKLGSRYSEVEKIRENSVRLELTKDNREQILETVTQRFNRWAGQGG